MTEFGDWIESNKGFPKADPVTDTNKVCTIENAELKDTKFGKKAIVDLKIDGVTKSIVMNKTMCQTFAKISGKDISSWKGLSVRTIPHISSYSGQTFQKLTIIPA